MRRRPVRSSPVTADMAARARGRPAVRGASSGAAPPAAARPPCGACKFLRRRCAAAGCVFAPHFSEAEGAKRFAAVHRVFGASNASKLIRHAPVARRGDAARSLCYEAQPRLSDPVYGCASAVVALRRQVVLLQAELSAVQLQLRSRRAAAGNLASLSVQQRQHAISGQQARHSDSSTSDNHSPGSCNRPSGGGAPRRLVTLRPTQPSPPDEGAGDGEGGKNPSGFAGKFTAKNERS